MNNSINSIKTFFDSVYNSVKNYNERKKIQRGLSLHVGTSNVYHGGCARSNPIGTCIGSLIFLILIIIVIVALMVPCGMNDNKPSLIIGKGFNKGRARRIHHPF